MQAMGCDAGHSASHPAPGEPCASEAPPAWTGAPLEAGDPEVFDRVDFLERACGDEEFARKIVELALDDIPARLGEFGRANAAGDARSAGVFVHSLKGLSGNLSARRLADTAGRLEAALKAGGSVDQDLAADLEREGRLLLEALGLTEWARGSGD